MQPILITTAALVITLLLWKNRWYFFHSWRTRQLKRQAAKLGFYAFTKSFQDEIIPHPVNSFTDTERLVNTMQFEIKQVTVTLFEVCLSNGLPLLGEGRTCLLFQSSQLDLPNFFLRPEGCLDKLANVAFGWQDIDFSLRPTFSEQYYLKSADEVTVRYFFSNDVLDLYEQQPLQCVEASNNKLLISRPTNQIKPSQLADYFSDAFRVFEKYRTLSQALQQADQIEQTTSRPASHQPQLTSNTTNQPTQQTPAAASNQPVAPAPAATATASPTKASDEFDGHSNDEEYLVL